MPFLASYLMPHAPVFIEEVGGGQVRSVKKTIEAMREIALEIKQLNPDTIVIVSPHGPVFSDAISVYNQKEYYGDFRAFGDFVHSYSIEKDQAFLDNLIEVSDTNGGDFYPVDEAIFLKYGYEPQLDHGILVPLHFILKEVPDVKVLALSYGTFSYQRLIENGEIISKTVDALDKKVVFIASGDMSHALKDSGPYDYDVDGPKFDGLMEENIRSQMPWRIFNESSELIAHASECGLRSFALMMGLLKNIGYKSKVLSYEGPFGVGYLCASFLVDPEKEPVEWWHDFVREKREKQEQARAVEHHYVKFARAVIESRIKSKLPPKLDYSYGNLKLYVSGKEIEFPDLIEAESLKRATFVSIKNQGSLRGCIGTIHPAHKNMIEEIYLNAIHAATKDSRFYPVDISELDDLDISVDVLSEMVLVTDTNELNPKKYGVFIVSQGRSGVLLPDLEGIDSISEQLRIACQKGGFTVDELEEIYRFTVDRYH